jgi:hypothetical protein
LLLHLFCALSRLRKVARPVLQQPMPLVLQLPVPLVPLRQLLAVALLDGVSPGTMLCLWMNPNASAKQMKPSR